MRSSVGICSMVKPTESASDHHIGHRASRGAGTVLVVVVLVVVEVLAIVLTVCGSSGASAKVGVTAIEASEMMMPTNRRSLRDVMVRLSDGGRVRAQQCVRQANTTALTLQDRLPFCLCERMRLQVIRLCVSDQIPAVRWSVRSCCCSHRATFHR